MTEALMNKIRVNTEMISLDEDSESIYGKIAEAYKTEPAVVNMADFWNNVEKLDMQPKKTWQDRALRIGKYAAAAFIGISLMGCLGQTVPPEETHTPEPTSTPTITPMPTTLPPTTSPPITVSPTPTGTVVPVEKVIHYKDYVGVAKDSELGKLYDTFMVQVKDDDSSDYAYMQAAIPFITSSKANGTFHNIYNSKISPYTILIDKLDMEALNKIKEFDNPTKKAILEYRDKWSNNDIMITLTKVGHTYIFYFGTDFANSSATKDDKNSIFTRVGCNKWNSANCKPYTFPKWEEACWFFYLPEKSAEDFISYLEKKSSV